MFISTFFLILIAGLIVLSLFIGITNLLHLYTTSSAVNKLHTSVERRISDMEKSRRDSKDPNNTTQQSPQNLQFSTQHLTIPPLSAKQTGSISVKSELKQTFPSFKKVEEPAPTPVESTQLSSNQSQGVPPQPSLSSPTLKSSQPISGKQIHAPQPPDSLKKTDSLKTLPAVELPIEQPLFQQYPSVDISSDDIMDIVDESKTDDLTQSIAITQQHGPLTVAVYSETTKDADFNKVFYNLDDTITAAQHPHINLDFKNIQYIYDTEIEFLRQIMQKIQTHDGTLSFINCSNELSTILKKDEKLALLIHE